MTVSVDDLVERARRRIRRVGPHELEGLVAEGGLVVDIRPAEQRRQEGAMPGALVVERNVLEWRLDPASDHRLSEVRGFGQPVVVVCSAGFASSLAAASLTDLGYQRAADLIGGYQAWGAWFARRAPRPESLGLDDEPSPPAGPPENVNGIPQGASA
ncbi:MAG: rhodanese-like domain-containing protein [Acidimicrobiales bacterium]